LRKVTKDSIIQLIAHHCLYPGYMYQVSTRHQAYIILISQRDK